MREGVSECQGNDCELKYKLTIKGDGEWSGGKEGWKRERVMIKSSRRT